MSGTTLGLISIGLIVLLISSGMHVTVALAAVCLIGVCLLKGSLALAGYSLASSAIDTIQSYDFGVIPLFVLMGLLVSVSDVGKDTFMAANQMFRRLRGGLGVATVAANAVFAATTGVSIASAAVFTKVAVPEMIRHGYLPRFAVGVVAGSSILGMLIPPSLLLIVFGVLSEVSIGKLFLAGILPGLLLGAMFALGIVWMAYKQPHRVLATPGGIGRQATALLSPIVLTGKLVPIVALVVVVIGGIYAGYFTATEAGAIGALGATMLAIVRRKLTWPTTRHVLMETGHITSSICLLIIGASMYSRMLALSGVPGLLTQGIAEAQLGFLPLMTLYLLLLLVLGTFLDSVSILLLVVPLALPVFNAFHVDLVWFGLITVVAIEVGIITPPLGIGAFVVKATLEDKSITLGDVFAGAIPFVLIMCLLLVLLVAFPGIATVLVH